MVREQGIGDTVQFMRFLSHLAAKFREWGDATILFQCHASLVTVLQESGYSNLVKTGDTISYRYWTPIMSLPYRLNLGETDFEMRAPYLRASEHRIQKWKQALLKHPGFKIGIHWQGSKAYQADKYRSFPVSLFRKVSQIPGVQLINLQVGEPREQLQDPNLGFSVIDYMDQMDKEGAFTDTIAMLKSLDLVITCDSAIGHIAGALGVPVWLPQCFAPHWPWQLAREDSLWYPSVRLFRQSSRGDWTSVFERMARELPAFLYRR